MRRRVLRECHHALEDEMPSFYLAETVKYLYLLFDEDNFISRDLTF